MKTGILKGLLFLVCTGSLFAGNPLSPAPEAGVLDLRETRLDKNAIYSLNGEWEFFWEKLLTPEEYKKERNREPGLLVNVPSYFSNYKIGEESLPGMGFGTYCLTIILPENNQSVICFDIPVFDVAFKFYLNDRLIESNGTVGTSRDEEDPWYKPSSFCYIPGSDTVQVLIQVSNFHHRRGGFWQSIFMGGSDKVLERMERRRMFNYSTIGVLFFFTFFFIIFCHDQDVSMKEFEK